MDCTNITKDSERQKITFDDVYHIVGSFGIYQGALFFTAMIGSFWTIEAIFMNFVAYEPDHWCYVPQLANLSFQQQKYIAIPSASGGYR